jgi:hypothetical protein
MYKRWSPKVRLFLSSSKKYHISDAGRWKNLGVPVVNGGQNLPSLVGIGLTDLPNIGGPVPPPVPPVPASLLYRVGLWGLKICTSQWYMVLNKRVQWVFFENILTNCFHTSSSLSNKKFRGLMVRRLAFHTEIQGSIPLAGSFAFFSSFSYFFLVFQKKASASASVVQKPPIPTNRDCYLQNRHDSG